MSDINWSQKVVVVTDGSDDYVATSGGFMLAEEYVSEGGRVEGASWFGDSEVHEVGRFTHLELQALYG